MRSTSTAPAAGEVRRFFVDNARMWLRDYHVDGLRLDAVPRVARTRRTIVLADLSEAVHAARVRPDNVLIAEDENDDAGSSRRAAQGGCGLDAIWADDFHHTRPRRSSQASATATTRSTRARRGTGAARALGQRSSRVATSCSRRTTTRSATGRKASGSSTSLATPRRAVAAGILLQSSGVPMLFQGEEWGASTPFLYFTDHPDPELAAHVRDGRRAEFAAFGWREDDVPDPQDPDAFARSVLCWGEQERPNHAAMLDWYRTLIRARRRLTSGFLGQVATEATDDAVETRARSASG